MDNTVMWVVIAAIAALIVLGIVIGPRLKGAKIKLGNHITGEVQGTSAGPTVTRAEAYGTKNRITADGDGATVQDVRAVGTENVIGAGTGGTGGKPPK